MCESLIAVMEIAFFQLFSVHSYAIKILFHKFQNFSIIINDYIICLIYFASFKTLFTTLYYMIIKKII